MKCKVLCLLSLSSLPGMLQSCVAAAYSHPIPDYTMQVVVEPLPQPHWGPSAADLQLIWDDLARMPASRELSPPTPPPALAAVLWAFDNVQNAWRLLFPIPPAQVPDLALSAAEPLRELVRVSISRSPGVSGHRSKP